MFLAATNDTGATGNGLTYPVGQNQMLGRTRKSASDTLTSTCDPGDGQSVGRTTVGMGKSHTMT